MSGVRPSEPLIPATLRAAEYVQQLPALPVGSLPIDKVGRRPAGLCFRPFQQPLAARRGGAPRPRRARAAPRMCRAPLTCPGPFLGRSIKLRSQAFAKGRLDPLPSSTPPPWQLTPRPTRANLPPPTHTRAPAGVCQGAAGPADIPGLAAGQPARHGPPDHRAVRGVRCVFVCSSGVLGGVLRLPAHAPAHVCNAVMVRRS